MYLFSSATQKKADGSMLNMDLSKMPSTLKGYVNALGVSDNDILNYLKKRQGKEVNCLIYQ